MIPETGVPSVFTGGFQDSVVWAAVAGDVKASSAANTAAMDSMVRMVLTKCRAAGRSSARTRGVVRFLIFLPSGL